MTSTSTDAEKPVKLVELLSQLDDAVQKVADEERALNDAKQAYDTAVTTHTAALDAAQDLQQRLQERIASLVPAGRVRAS